MQTATRRSVRGFVPSFALFAVVAFALSMLAPPDVRAQAQTDDQQKCLNALYKAAANTAKAQGKQNLACIKDDQKGNLDNLGVPPQEQTADACLTNDPKGKVDKKADKVTAAEATKCATAPDFGTAGAAQIIAATTVEKRGIIRDVFGPVLAPIVQDSGTYGDSAGEKCQPEAVKRLNKLNDTLWKEATKAAKASLAGKNVPQATTGAALQAAIIGALTADVKNKVGKAEDVATAKIASTCGASIDPLLELFRGKCTPNTVGDFSQCAIEATRCRFCNGLSAVTGEPADCDTFDDGAANGSCAPCASARVITNLGELISGPLAHGQISDYIIENGVARFIIQRPNVRDMYSVGAFGGNIIDAELVGHPNLDNFLEIQPALNIETVINATSLQIVNDGADCSAAIIRTCGPDDVLDFVNASTVVEGIGLDFPNGADDVDQDVDACTDYILEPGDPYLKMVTTVNNNSNAQLGMFAGDYLNAAGEVEQWCSGDAGIGERLTADMGVFSYFGYGDAQGVDYGVTTIPIVDATPQSTSFFSTSGVSYILHSQGVIDALINQVPEFQVPANSSRSYTRYFGVGDGSGGNTINLENIVKAKAHGTISGCVTVNAVPAPGARVSIGPLTGPNLNRVTSTWVTDSTGCYAGTVPVGNYGVSAWREGTPYEGGGSTPTVHNVTISAATNVIQNFNLPQTGAVSVTVVDEDSDPVPARVTVVGFDPSPDQTLAGPTGVHRDQVDVRLFGIAWFQYTDAVGTTTFDMEPGTYRVYVSRGPEYSLYEAPLTVTAGVTTAVNAQIARVLDTDGFISSDHHVHAIASADSRVKNSDRVRQFAGEGVDNIIITDHHVHTDLLPVISSLGYNGLVTSTLGEEITTWDGGHFNAYPMLQDLSRPSKGSTDWGGAEPAGTDFTSLGSYILTPAQVDNLARTGATSTPDTVVQINHIDSHFVPLQIDTSLIPPASALNAAGKTRFRLDPATVNLFHHFAALELWNGDGRSHQNQFLNGRIGVWFNHLNQGLITTAVADTDTHKFMNLETAGARSWSASSTDDPGSMLPGEIAQSVTDGRLVGGQGIYVQTRLVDASDPGNVADLTITGSTLLDVSVPATGLELEIDVQAPLWAEFDQILVYSNAATTSVGGATPQLFTATPTMTLNKGVDFTVTVNNVEPLVPGGSRQEVSLSIPFSGMTEDAWYVVVVKGTDGISRPMFPVHPANLATAGNGTLAGLIDGNLGQQGVTALGYTNALYANADGDPGFDPPLP